VNHTMDDWMVKKDGGNKFQDEICRPVSSAELANIVKTHKDMRASGTDNLPTRLFRNASPGYYKRLEELINLCLSSGETPQCLNTAKITLIDKKNLRCVSQRKGH